VELANSPPTTFKSPSALTIGNPYTKLELSPDLAEDLARIIERNTQGDNAWHVRLDDDGPLFWQDRDETVTEQPARDGMQRVMNVLMKLGPVEQF
jgi:putative cardiolipin synthase